MKNLRILYVACEEIDYLSDSLYGGLVKILGRKNVVDFPYRKKYHLEKSEKKSRIPMLNYVGKGKKFNSVDEIKENEFDYLFIASFHKNVIPIIHELSKKFPKEKIVIIDGVDDPFIRTSMKSGFYFKRENLKNIWGSYKYLLTRIYYKLKFDAVYVKQMLLKPHEAHIYFKGISTIPSCWKKVHSLPFSIRDMGYEPKEKKETDLLFIGNLQPLKRKKMARFIKQYSRENNLKCIVKETSSLKWEDYMELLGSSRVCLSVRGLGFDTLRYWEIPYAGSLLFSEQPLIDIPENFEDGEEAVFFENFHELRDKLDNLFENEERIKKITEKGREKLLEEHTSEKRAKYILESISEHNNEQ